MRHLPQNVAVEQRAFLTRLPRKATQLCTHPRQQRFQGICVCVSSRRGPPKPAFYNHTTIEAVVSIISTAIHQRRSSSSSRTELLLAYLAWLQAGAEANCLRATFRAWLPVYRRHGAFDCETLTYTHCVLPHPAQSHTKQGGGHRIARCVFCPLVRWRASLHATQRTKPGQGQRWRAVNTTGCS